MWERSGKSCKFIVLQMCKLLAEFFSRSVHPVYKKHDNTNLQGLNNDNKYVYALVNRIEKVS